MSKKIGKHFLYLLLIILVFFLGCVTAPNIPFAGKPHPSILKELAQRNPLFFQEIGKLPEIQDGVSQAERNALERICYLYDLDTEKFDKIFKKMYQIGLPKVRKYCSPLQALFWITETGELDTVNELLNHYSLEKLLSIAWIFDPPAISDQQILEIINGINDEGIKAEYIRDWKSMGNAKTQKFLLMDIKRVKYAFSKDAIKKILSFNTKNPKWNDFVTVQERLNAPELVNYYEQNQIHWVDWRTLPTWPVSPNYVFKYGKGDCTAIANFTASCLKKAGYKAYEYKVAARRSVDSHHSICIFFANGIKYSMDNGSPLQRGIQRYDK